LPTLGLASLLLLPGTVDGHGRCSRFLLLCLSSCSNKTGLSVPLVILIHSRPCPMNLMVCLMKSHLKGLSPDPNREIKLRPRAFELHSPAVVPPCSRRFLREPQRDRRAALPKSENTWPSRNVGTGGSRFSASGSLAPSGVRFEGSCRKGKLLSWIFLLDQILPLTTLAGAWSKFWKPDVDGWIV
jgi:hypothetical protein